MSNNILIASCDQGEIADFRSVLGDEYKVNALSSPDQFSGDLGEYDLLLLDQNFTEYKGIDFLMSVLVNKQTPALVLTSPEDAKSAAEAMNVGAFNFVIKSEGFKELLSFAIDDSIKRFTEQRNMQDTISGLRKNVTELKGSIVTLETKVKEARTQQKPAVSNNAQVAPENVERTLLQDVIATLKSGDINLPVYPEICNKFKDLINRAANVKEISDLLQKDPAISSKMISVANSAYYRGMVPIKTLEQALSRVGISEARNYVALISNRALYMGEKPKYKEFLQQEWKHSLCCAYACQELSRALLIKNPAELFALGLFHDIGKILLIQLLAKLENTEGYREVPDEEWHIFLAQNHCQFGASLMKKWKLTEEYWQVAKFHENPKEAGDAESDELKMVCLANIIAKDMGYPNEANKDLVNFADCHAAKELNISSERIEELKASIAEMMEAGMVV